MGDDEGAQSWAPLAELEGCADFTFKPWHPAANFREATATHDVACCVTVIVTATIITMKPLVRASVWGDLRDLCRQIGSCVFEIRASCRAVR